MTEETTTENIKDLLPEEITGEISEDILALKKEIAKKYIKELKEKKDMGVGKLLIGKGKSLEKYLVSENKGDQIMDTIKGNIMDKFFGSVYKQQSFVIRGVTYNSIFDYLKTVKEKLDNAKTEAELKILENEILTASAVVAPAVVSTVNDTTNTTTIEGPSNSAERITGNYVYPVPGVKINSPFGGRVNNGKNEDHKGIDIADSTEEHDILSVGKGVVEYVSPKEDAGFSGYGNCVVVKLDNGYRVLYGHLASYTVKVGDEVKASEKIGIMGNSGAEWTGKHLHFEVREGDSYGGLHSDDGGVSFFNSKAIDPLRLLPVTKEMIQPDLIADNRITMNLLEEQSA